MSTQEPVGKNERPLPQCAGGFVRADLKAYLDRELSPLRRWYVGRHMAGCPACTEEVAWLQRLGKNMRQLEDAYPRPELRARILSTLPPMEAAPLLAANTQTQNRTDGTGRLRYAFAGAFALLIVAGAFAALRHNVGRGSTQLANNAVRNPTYESHSKANVSVNVGPTAPPSFTNPVVSAEAPRIERDPTSLEADKLFAIQTAKEKDLAARLLPRDWNRAVTSVRTELTAGKTHNTPYVQVTLGVKSVDLAKSRLESWARLSKSEAHVYASADPGRPGASVVLLISAAESGALFNNLKQLGQISGVARGDANGPVKFSAYPSASDDPRAAALPRSVEKDKHPELQVQKPADARGVAGVKSEAGHSSTTPAIMVVIQLGPLGPSVTL